MRPRLRSRSWRRPCQRYLTVSVSIAAIDLFVVPTIGFNLIYAFVIVRLERRDLVRAASTTLHSNGGKQAKILSDNQVERLRNPRRNRVLVLLSLKAGLRAGENRQPDLADGSGPGRRNRLGKPLSVPKTPSTGLARQQGQPA